MTAGAEQIPMGREWTVTVAAPDVWLRTDVHRAPWSAAALGTAWQTVTAAAARAAGMPHLAAAWIRPAARFPDGWQACDGRVFEPTAAAATAGLADQVVLAPLTIGAPLGLVLPSSLGQLELMVTELLSLDGRS